jgi:restriction system protein
MGRNRGFTAALVQIQRESERQARAQAAAATRAAREAERAHRAYERAQAAEAKEYKRLYVESRMADVELRNEELQDDVAMLQQLLADTLAVDDFLDFDTLKDAAPLPVFAPGPLASPEPPPNPDAYRPPEPTGLRARLPGAREKHLTKWEEGRVAYEAAAAAYQQREAERQRRLAAAQADHDKTVAELEARLAAQHAEVEQFKAAFQAGTPTAVMQYFALVLEASSYPDDFPQQFRLAFVPESRQLVVEYELPLYDRVPAVAAFTYVKSGDKVNEKARPARERQQLYKSVVAQVTVRTIHELSKPTAPAWSKRSCSTATSRPSTPPPARPNGPAWSPSAPPATHSWTVTSPASMPRHALLTYRPACPRARPSWCQSGRCWSSTWSTRGSWRKPTCCPGWISGPTSWNSSQASSSR